MDRFESLDTYGKLRYINAGPMVCHHTSRRRGTSLVPNAPKELFVKSVRGESILVTHVVRLSQWIHLAPAHLRICTACATSHAQYVPGLPALGNALAARRLADAAVGSV